MTIELSDNLIEEKGMNEAKFRLELAIFLFKKEFYTLGKASEFCEIPQFLFQKELAKRKISVHYDVQDYRRDLKALNL